MNKEQLAEKAKEYAGSVDDARWLLAELALQAKTEGEVDEWAEVIGHVVRRKARTIYEWAQCADFRNALGIAIPLPYSFYARAMRAVTKLKTEHIVELMDTAAAEGVTLEAFSALLDDLCKPADEDEEPEDEPMEEPELTPAQRWKAIAERLEEDAYSWPAGTSWKPNLEQAAIQLREAMEYWVQENEPASLIDPAPLTRDDIDWATGEIVRHEGSLEDGLSAALEGAVNELNANGDGTMEASLYRHGRLVAGPGR